MIKVCSHCNGSGSVTVKNDKHKIKSQNVQLFSRELCPICHGVGTIRTETKP